MPRLFAYSDYASPLCWLARVALRRSLPPDAARPEYRALELWPRPSPLPDPASPEAARFWAERVVPLAADLGVAIERPRLAVRTRKAHEAAAFARDRELFDPMHDALFRAYFEDGRDIGRIDVVVAVGEAAGLDPTDLKIELDLDTYTERVLDDARSARRLGVEAAPALVADGRILYGVADAAAVRDLLHGAETEP